MSDVTRLVCWGGTMKELVDNFAGRTEYVLATDYDAMTAKRDALAQAIDRIAKERDALQQLGAAKDAHLAGMQDTQNAIQRRVVELVIREQEVIYIVAVLNDSDHGVEQGYSLVVDDVIAMTARLAACQEALIWMAKHGTPAAKVIAEEALAQEEA